MDSEYENDNEQPIEEPIKLRDLPLPERNREIVQRLFCCLPLRRLG